MKYATNFIYILTIVRDGLRQLKTCRNCDACRDLAEVTLMVLEQAVSFGEEVNK